MSEIIVKIKGFLSPSRKKRLIIKGYSQSAVASLLLIAASMLPAGFPALSYALAADSTASATSIQAIRSSLSGQGLPIGSISAKEVPNAKGLVIYFPQVHQNPGSQVSDPANNSAVQAQTEMRSIISSLVSHSSVKLMMAEGDLYGPVAADKMAQIKNKMTAESDLAKRTGDLKQMIATNSLDPSNESVVINKLSQADASAKRSLILKGAAYLVAAGQDGTIIYGAENKDTYDKSADLVRKYFYLEDRLAQVGGGGMAGNYGLRSSFPSNLKTMQTIQSPSTGSAGTLNSLLAKEVSLAQSSGRTDLAEMYQGLTQDIQTLDQADIIPNAPTNAPSRSDNPYASISSSAALNQMLRQTESQIQTTVIDQRNKETAVNFAKGLAAENQTVGILQFGAGHESGLVPELNKQGLSVLVVTSLEVAKSNGQPIQIQPTPVPTIVPTPTPVVTPVFTPEPTPVITAVPTPTPAISQTGNPLIDDQGQPSATPTPQVTPTPDIPTPEPMPTASVVPVATPTATPALSAKTSCEGMAPTPEPTPIITPTPVSVPTVVPAPVANPQGEKSMIEQPEVSRPVHNSPYHFFPTYNPVQITLPDGRVVNSYSVTTYLQ